MQFLSQSKLLILCLLLSVVIACSEESPAEPISSSAVPTLSSDTPDPEPTEIAETDEPTAVPVTPTEVSATDEPQTEAVVAEAVEEESADNSSPTLTPNWNETATAGAPTLTPNWAETAEAGAPTATPDWAATSAAAPTAAIAQQADQPEHLKTQIGPFNFPENLNPLTGLPFSSPDAANRRPIAVKISNSPAIVRPQHGLNSADIMFEHYAEGGVTRFTGVFYGNDVDQIGSVRSARLIDLEIPQMYDAAFAYSGASGPVRLLIQDSDFFSRVISPDFGHDGFYRRDDGTKPFEHTLYTDTFFVRNILDFRNQNFKPTFNNYMTFNTWVPWGGWDATTVEIDYRATNAFWQYNPSKNGYDRWSDSQAHFDQLTNTQVNFTNVAVVEVFHIDTLILEDNVGGGNYSIEIQLWGFGPATIFRNGQAWPALWHRDAKNEMITFTDLNNEPFPLAPGNTFIQLVPLEFDGLTFK